jgi:transcriptional regulator with XRE-family HTH domain
MSDNDTSSIGLNVAKYRKVAKISAEELAVKAGRGLTRSIIANLENGRKSDLGVNQLIAVADVLGVAPDALMGGQSALRAAYAVQVRERVRLQNQLESYTLALLEVAVASDSAEALNDSDVSWLDSAMLEQSPAGMTADAGVIIDAAIAREGVNGNGHYVSQLRERVRREHDLLKPVDS